MAGIGKQDIVATNMPDRQLQFTEGMKTTTVGVIGTVTSFTLEQYSQMASAIAATVTALYMIFKCVDWIIEKHLKYRKNKSKKSI